MASFGEIAAKAAEAPAPAPAAAPVEGEAPKAGEAPAEVSNPYFCLPFCRGP